MRFKPTTSRCVIQDVVTMEAHVVSICTGLPLLEIGFYETKTYEY